MKSLYLFVFILFSGLSVVAKPIPENVSEQFTKLNLPNNGVFFIMDLQECVSCNFGYLEILSSASLFNNVELVFMDDMSKNKFEQITTASNFNLINIQLVKNEEIFTFFKKYKIVEYQNTEFSPIDINSLKNKATKPVQLTFKYEEKLPELNKAFNHDFFVKNNVTHAFNRDLGELYFRKSIDSTIKIEFYNRINPTDLLRVLNLNPTDLELTERDLVSSKLPGSRFVDFLFYCPSDNREKYYFSASLNYFHKLDSAEIIDLEKNSPKDLYKQIKSLKGDVTIMRNKPILFVFDENWKVLEVKQIDTLPSEYNFDFYSPMLIQDSSIVGNVKFYPKTTKNFSDGNFASAKYEISESLVKFIEFSKYTKPLWFSKNKLFNNFSNYTVQCDGGHDYLSLISYPMVIDVSRNIKLEVPSTNQEAILKCEKSKLEKKSPSFQTLGTHYEENLGYKLYIKSFKSKKIYVVNLDESGKYLHFQALEENPQFPGSYWFFKNQICQIQGDIIYYFDLK